MSQAQFNLFDYAVEFITPEDVALFAPADPGYHGYVSTWCAILKHRKVPRRLTFEVSETIDMTQWGHANRTSDPLRFRRFRVLTSAVEVSLLLDGLADIWSFPPNYVIVRLLDDALALGDTALVRLTRPVLEELHRFLLEDDADEAPFALLGVMLADAILGASAQALSSQTDQLMQEENQFGGQFSGDFLFGCTNFDTLNKVWISLIRQLLPPATPQLTLLRDALLTR
jgi:hypothetical protein